MGHPAPVDDLIQYAIYNAECRLYAQQKANGWVEQVKLQLVKQSTADIATNRSALQNTKENEYL